MGLLSKIFGGDAEAEKTAKDLLQGIFGGAEKKESSPDTYGPDENVNETVAGEERKTDSPSGDSWGEEMPAEENQFNYNGSYVQYFENIFATEFAAYRTEKDTVSQNRQIYTFYNASAKALVVELMSQSCAAYKTREDCRKNNIPYLRFYHDHDGWWNTRSYVVRRIGNALQG